MSGMLRGKGLWSGSTDHTTLSKTSNVLVGDGSLELLALEGVAESMNTDGGRDSSTAITPHHTTSMSRSGVVGLGGVTLGGVSESMGSDGGHVSKVGSTVMSTMECQMFR